MKIFVGNLSWDATDADLKDAFSAFGGVSEASIVKDRETGRSRGFGFVVMDNDGEANAAIEGMNGKEIAGRAIVVNEARPREEGASRGPRRDFRR
ncbi:MAG: RNA-binding protein [Patescibacteria group bacterium]